MAGNPTAVIHPLEVKLGNYIKKINEAISKELQIYSRSRFYDPLIYAVEGGKRVRPLILLLAAEASGCKDNSALDAAVAVELLHTESIIHDDIIDEEVVRRDKVAFHIKYGYSASLLTADFVFAMILAIAARYKDSRVVNEISNAALAMAEGEYSELTIDPKIYRLSMDEYIKIITLKTASLFQASAKLGAIVAGAPEKEIKLFSNYGKFLGIAYQLHDDLMDLGNEEKITLGLMHNLSKKEVALKIKELSVEYAERAKEELSDITESEAKRYLIELADFSVQRKH